MIVHNSTNPLIPKSRQTRFWLVTAFAFLTYEVWNVTLQFGRLFARNESGIARFSAGGDLYIGILIGGIAAGYLIFVFRRSGKKRRMVATADTLVVQTAGEKASFRYKDKCFAIGNDGSRFMFKNGSALELTADGASQESLDKFHQQLYDLWWPGVNLSDMRERLELKRRKGWQAIRERVSFVTDGLLVEVVGIVLIVAFIFWEVAALIALIALPIYFFWLARSGARRSVRKDEYIRVKSLPTLKTRPQCVKNCEGEDDCS